MSFAYTDIRDAQQHLQHSVIMYDGRPVWVNEIFNHEQTFKVSISSLPRQRDPITVDLMDPLLGPREARLGYVNSNLGYALYLTRIPLRQYKQGLCRSNVHIPGVNGQRIVNFENLIREPGFADSLRNIYPTYDEAANRLNENPNVRSVAFDKCFALERDELGFFRLFYKGEPVAFGEDKSFKLPKKFCYLKEMISELGVDCA